MVTSRSANRLPKPSLWRKVGSTMSKFLRASRYLGSSWSCRRMMICCSMMWLQAKANLKANLRSTELIVWFMQRKSATSASGSGVRYTASNSSQAAVASRTARQPKWKNCAAMPSSRAFRKRSRSLRSTLSLISEIELRINGFRLANSRPRSSSNGFRDYSNLAITRSMSSVNLKVSSFSGTGGTFTRGSQSLSTTSARSSQQCVKEESARTTDFLGFSPSKIELIWYWQRLSSDYICLKSLSSHPSITLETSHSIGPTQHTQTRKISVLKIHVETQKTDEVGENPKRTVFYSLQARYELPEGCGCAGKSYSESETDASCRSCEPSMTIVTLIETFPSSLPYESASTPYFSTKTHPAPLELSQNLTVSLEQAGAINFSWFPLESYSTIM